jgi:formylglycine-generating enzyme required for sulfatase activity
MISNYGLEDCCGVLWQWTSDITSHFNSKGTSSTYQYGGLVQTAQTSSDEGAHWIDGYGWQTDGRGTSNINVDGSASLDGNSYGVFTRALVGGSCLNGTNCGSRSVLGNILSSGGIAIRACRLESEPRVVNL